MQQKQDTWKCKVANVYNLTLHLWWVMQMLVSSCERLHLVIVAPQAVVKGTGTT